MRNNYKKFFLKNNINLSLIKLFFKTDDETRNQILNYSNCKSIEQIRDVYKFIQACIFRFKSNDETVIKDACDELLSMGISIGDFFVISKLFDLKKEKVDIVIKYIKDNTNSFDNLYSNRFKNDSSKINELESRMEKINLSLEGNKESYVTYFKEISAEKLEELKKSLKLYCEEYPEYKNAVDKITVDDLKDNSEKNKTRDEFLDSCDWCRTGPSDLCSEFQQIMNNNLLEYAISLLKTKNNYDSNISYDDYIYYLYSKEKLGDYIRNLKSGSLEFFKELDNKKMIKKNIRKVRGANNNLLINMKSKFNSWSSNVFDKLFLGKVEFFNKDSNVSYFSLYRRKKLYSKKDRENVSKLLGSLIENKFGYNLYYNSDTINVILNGLDPIKERENSVKLLKEKDDYFNQLIDKLEGKESNISDFTSKLSLDDIIVAAGLSFDERKINLIKGNLSNISSVYGQKNLEISLKEKKLFKTIFENIKEKEYSSITKLLKDNEIKIKPKELLLKFNCWLFLDNNDLLEKHINMNDFIDQYMDFSVNFGNLKVTSADKFENIGIKAFESVNSLIKKDEIKKIMGNKSYLDVYNKVVSFDKNVGSFRDELNKCVEKNFSVNEIYSLVKNLSNNVKKSDLSNDDLSVVATMEEIFRDFSSHIKNNKDGYLKDMSENISLNNFLDACILYDVKFSTDFLKVYSKEIPADSYIVMSKQAHGIAYADQVYKNYVGIFNNYRSLLEKVQKGDTLEKSEQEFLNKSNEDQNLIKIFSYLDKKEKMDEVLNCLSLNPSVEFVSEEKADGSREFLTKDSVGYKERCFERALKIAKESEFSLTDCSYALNIEGPDGLDRKGLLTSDIYMKFAKEMNKKVELEKTISSGVSNVPKGNDEPKKISFAHKAKGNLAEVAGIIGNALVGGGVVGMALLASVGSIPVFPLGVVGCGLVAGGSVALGGFLSAIQIAYENNKSLFKLFSKNNKNVSSKTEEENKEIKIKKRPKNETNTSVINLGSQNNSNSLADTIQVNSSKIIDQENTKEVVSKKTDYINFYDINGYNIGFINKVTNFFNNSKKDYLNKFDNYLFDDKGNFFGLIDKNGSPMLIKDLEKNAIYDIDSEKNTSTIVGYLYDNEMYPIANMGLDENDRLVPNSAKVCFDIEDGKYREAYDGDGNVIGYLSNGGVISRDKPIIESEISLPAIVNNNLGNKEEISISEVVTTDKRNENSRRVISASVPTRKLDNKVESVINNWVRKSFEPTKRKAVDVSAGVVDLGVTAVKSGVNKINNEVQSFDFPSVDSFKSNASCLGWTVVTGVATAVGYGANALNNALETKTVIKRR